MEPAKKAEEEAFAWAVPLGASCLAAVWLRQRGLRKCALPFDWLFSSPAMVGDCLADDFRELLDPREYVAFGKRGAGCGHRRYSDMRLPGRWKGFVFLHHDPSRKRQDQDYLQRCVQRFRTIARSPKRKLFLLCTYRNAAASAVDAAAGASEETPEIQSSCALGSGASWEHASIAAVEGLFEALQAYGARNFHLAVVALHAGSMEAPVLRATRSATSEAGLESLEVHELQCACGQEADADPFAFFGNRQNEEAFSVAVLGAGPFTRQFRLEDLDGHAPQGYREAAPAAAPSGPPAAGLECRWCSIGGFQSRNKLFAHIRSTPGCAAAAAAADGQRALAAPSSAAASKSFVFLVGYASNRERACQRLLQGLAAAGATQLELHGAQGGPRAAACDLALASFSSGTQGEALWQGLQAALRSEDGEELRVHGLAPVPRVRLAELESTGETLAYLLPFHVLLGDGAAPEGQHETAAEGLRDLASGSWQREVYKSFKAVLRSLQRPDAGDDAGEAEARGGTAELAPEVLRMAERAVLAGEEHVVLHVSGSSEAQCLGLLAAAVAAHRGWTGGCGALPPPPRELLHLETRRCAAYERRHGPLLSGACSASAGPEAAAQAQAAWRGELRERLASCWAAGPHWAAWLRELEAAAASPAEAAGGGR